MQVTHYFDYKSPYAFLAQEATVALDRELGLEIDWLPYGLDIRAYAGDAELDEHGRDKVGARNAHQWRRVRYAYMDCRREASRRGLVLRGPRRIFDSTTSHVGMLYAKRAGDFRGYHDLVYERFFRRELDLEDRHAIRDVLVEAGHAAGDFFAYLDGEGRAAYERIMADALARGVFGVPSYLVGGELFWGAERIERVRERVLAARGR